MRINEASIRRGFVKKRECGMLPLVQYFLGWYIIFMLSIGSETKALIDN